MEENERLMKENTKLVKKVDQLEDRIHKIVMSVANGVMKKNPED